MVQRPQCEHLATASDIPLTTIVNSVEKKQCTDCDVSGPNLWICLFKNCLRIGCSEQANDHSTLHNRNQPNHSIHMNLTTQRIWCYGCKSEVFMETSTNASVENENLDIETSTGRSKDSGHGSFSTLRTETPEKNVYGFERSVGLNVGMSGDASESSEDEDTAYSSMERPCGLIGLQNIGNTCYMNAALQALSNTEPLTKFFLDCSAAVHLLSEGRKPGLSRTYQALVRDIWIKKSGGYVVPSGILYGIRHVHPMFRGYQQHDTQEFLRNFMDQLHEELKQMAAPEPTPISECENFAMAMDEPTLSSSYDSSEGEYETCDSGVSERSSLSDDTERPTSSTKRRLSRCGSPNRRQRPRVASCNVIDSQPGTSSPSFSTTNRKQVKYRSIISDIFDGKLLSSVQCLTCNRVSSRVETFQDLSLPIPSRDHLAVLHGRSLPGTTCSEAVIPVQDGWIAWMLSWLKSWFYGPTITLHDCLAAFFSTDELKGDNMYSCEKCNKLRNGIKFSKVLQLPEVLCIHLKRFRHELMFSSKISSAVSFPLKGLDMRPYLHSDCTSTVSNYELFSVICHHGTAGGGHYICYAYNSGYWYEFDDQYVTRVTPEKVQTCEAYVLFYRKVTTNMEPIRTEAMTIAEETVEANLPTVYLSRQWLNRFHYCAEPGPIDNSDFLCQHGALNPDRTQSISQLAVSVPVELYEYLYQKFGGCPALPSVIICPACQAIRKKILSETETFLKLSRDVQNYDIPQTHYLSTLWYTQWHNFIQRKSLEPPGPIDNTKININHLDLNDTLEISEDMWNFFYGAYGGGPELRIKPPISYEKMSNSGCEYEEEWNGYNNTAQHNGPVDPQKKEKTIEQNQCVFSHGEPMETDVENNTNETAIVDSTTEPEDGKPGHALQVNKVTNTNQLTDNDMDEEEINEIRNNSKHRRRRRNVTSL